MQCQVIIMNPDGDVIYRCLHDVVDLMMIVEANEFRRVRDEIASNRSVTVGFAIVSPMLAVASGK